ncbi:MAG: PglD-related sugar-binding protein [Bacteroidota bacterium]
MNQEVIILGARDWGKIALEIFQKNNIIVYGFLDDDPKLWGKIINHVPVLGSTTAQDYLDLIGKNCGAFVAIAQQSIRQRLITMLHQQKQIAPTSAIHPSVIMATSAACGYGNLIDAGASLGVDVVMGNHCILHAHTTIGEATVIEDFVQVGAGSVVGSGVTLREKVFVGAGATIVAGVEIGVGASVGIGAVVLADVKPGEAVLGNPAKPVKL